MTIRKIRLFERIFLQVKELVLGSELFSFCRIPSSRKGVVVDDLPAVIDVTGEVTAAVLMREMVEKVLLATLVPAAGQLLFEVIAIKRHVMGEFDLCQLADGGQQIQDRSHLGLDRSCGDGESLLRCVVSICFSPRGDEGDEHAALVAPALLLPVGGGAVVALLCRCGASEPLSPTKMIRVLCALPCEFLQFDHQVSEGLVHAFDQGGVGLGVFVCSRLRVVSGEAWVGLERGMQGIVRHVEEEGLLLCDAGFDVSIGFQGEGFGEEGVGAVVLSPGAEPVLFSRCARSFSLRNSCRAALRKSRRR